MKNNCKLIILNLIVITFILLNISSSIVAQSISGTVKDARTSETIIGANISLENDNGVISNEKGFYYLQLLPGTYHLIFSYIGYASQSKEIILLEDQNLILNIDLFVENNLLNTIVISGSLYEKKLTEETMSVDVIKSDLLHNTNSTNLSDAITKSPGIYMLDEQANIRGGTGFTYGAGSRVMLVVDDQILLAADRGDAKWNFVPIENTEQIEIIKGASSVLYGSSALNGVIAVRTAWPTSIPYNSITIYQGVYDDASFKPATWYDVNPIFTGINFSHREKYKKFDLVLGGHLSQTNSYLQGQHSTRARLNWKTRLHSKNNLFTYGLNGNAMLDNEGIYFLWGGYDTLAYQPFGGNINEPTSTLLNWNFKWLTIDPWVNYTDKFKNEHHLKMRFYNNNVFYSDSTGGNAWLLNLDYQFHRELGNNFFITSGITGYKFHVRDDQLLDHDGFLAGGYFQIDKKIFNRLTIDAGVREELYKLDTANANGVPIFKGGINYKINNSTFLRGSYGQGYRFPSLVEKFAQTSLGVLNIFPNNEISAEYGWNAEIGIKRQIKIDHWVGFADAAFYITDYHDMTEFVFDFYSGRPGFKSLNNTRARIGGMELTLTGEGIVFNHKLSFTGGYNYVYPADIAADSSNLNFGSFANNFISGFSAHPIDSSFLSSVLKYRFRHLFRVDAQYELNKFSFGTDINFYSLMENLDVIYTSFIPGINEYRNEHLNGDWVFDARVAYKISSTSQIQILVKNIFNHMYALRVAKYDPPRNFTVQYKVDF